jgi:RIO kinase 1
MDILEQRIHGVKLRKDSDRKQVQDEVFDERTLLTIYDLINREQIFTIEYPVSTGKEGNVFAATAAEGLVAVKIYRITNANFNAMQAYIVGDPRFAGLVGNKKKLVHEWCKKEFRNLTRYHEAGLPVPRPLAQKDNVLVMSYVGDESGPAPVMKFSPPKDLDEAKKWREVLLDFIVAGRQAADLVHGDLSEFNVLVFKDAPVVIDVGQAVVGGHANAAEFLRRDVENVVRYFDAHGVEAEKGLVERTVREAMRKEEKKR